MAMIIIFKSGFQAGNEISFDLDGISFGRDPVCDVVVDDIEVSRHHARIYQSGNDYYIEDLNSTNGTYLNGKLVKKHEIIRSGDLLTLGESIQIEFRVDDVLEIDSQLTNARVGDVVSQEEYTPSHVAYQKNSRQAINPSAMPVPVGNKWLNHLPSWLIIVVIALAFLVFFCFIPFIIIEVSNQWCNLFSGFFNALSPGSCP